MSVMERHFTFCNPVTPSPKGTVRGRVRAMQLNSRNKVTAFQGTNAMNAYAQQEAAFTLACEALATQAATRDAHKGDVKEAASLATQAERVAAWAALDALAIQGEEETDEQRTQRATDYGLAIAKANGADKGARVYAQRMRYALANLATVLKHGEPVTDADTGEQTFPRLKRSPLSVAKGMMTREATNAERAIEEAKEAAARKATRKAYLSPACERVAATVADDGTRPYGDASDVLASYMEGEADTVEAVDAAMAMLASEATLADDFAAMLARVVAAPNALDLLQLAMNATDALLASVPQVEEEQQAAA